MTDDRPQPEVATPAGKSGFLRRWRTSVRRLKDDVYALWLAARDPRTPWYARALVGLVAAYALSPIDLIPDFIPVVGYLDDLVLVPLGIMLAIRLVPREVLDEARGKANTAMGARPGSLVGVAVVAGLWVLGMILSGLILYRHFGA